MGNTLVGSVLIDHQGVARVVYQLETHECFLINHKPDYRLTGLYYDLHDKQLTNQKAVDSSGSYKEWEKLYSMETGPCVCTCGVVYSGSVY